MIKINHFYIIKKKIKSYDEQSRAEQSRAEQSRAEQSRAEQSRAEQSRAEQSRLLSDIVTLSFDLTNTGNEALTVSDGVLKLA